MVPILIVKYHRAKQKFYVSNDILSVSNNQDF